MKITVRNTYQYPVRNGGPDELHTHGWGPQPDSVKESCGGCAQLRNDFVWLRYHDALAAEAALTEIEVA